MIPSWQKSRQSEGLLPSEFLSDPAACLAGLGTILKKSGFHRLVYRLDGLLVKEFAFSSLYERLKWKYGLSAPQKEYAALEALWEEGVPVPRPLALGHAREGRAVKVWLVTEFLEGCITYDEVRPKFDVLQISALANAVAGMHAASYIHHDLHAGNLLWQKSTGKWFITDFQHARRGLCTRPMLEGDLVQLQHCLGKKVPLRQRVVFLREYVRSFAEWTETLDTHSGRDWHLVWHEVSERIWDYDTALARGRSRRAFGRNRHYLPFKKGPARGFIMRGESSLLTADALELLKNPQWSFQPEISRQERRHGMTSAIFRHPQGDLGLMVFQCRQNFLHRLLPFLDPAMRLWRNAARLGLLHIPCQRPVFLARSQEGYAYGSLSVIKFSLKEFANLERQCGSRLETIRNLGRFLGRLHRLGVAAGRLSGDGLGLSDSGEIFIGRPDRLSFYRDLPWFARVRDLSDLLYAFAGESSYFERRCFLRHYIRSLGGGIDTRLLISDVVYRARILDEDEREERRPMSGGRPAI